MQQQQKIFQMQSYMVFKQEHVFLCDPKYWDDFRVLNGDTLIVFTQTPITLIHLLTNLFTTNYVPGIMLVLGLQ